MPRKNINNQQPKLQTSKVKRICAVILILLAVPTLLGLAGVFFYKHDRVSNCTSTITGQVTNVEDKTNYSASSRRRRIRKRTEITVSGDGTFKSQKLYTDELCYAERDTVKIYYDPDDASKYYLEDDFEDFWVLMISLGIILAGETIGAAALLKSASKSKKQAGALKK